MAVSAPSFVAVMPVGTRFALAMTSTMSALFCPVEGTVIVKLASTPASGVLVAFVPMTVGDAITPYCITPLSSNRKE